ncbi:dihydrolipoamide acetyltransferase family protein [Microbacterium sp.]|uniref:dihydrolipoamide acetyltransferase family protein n=1 Tax=Microbacterium sp. TaxID=51671 RepID=UPI0028126A7E|nr:dihydrolipoamide acetyltransferase family protein [Microbacterium sp.]
MIDIHMPRLSDTMEEGAIAAWHKRPGDTVAVGDVLVEIETDKAVMDYEAYDSGILREILVPAGEEAAIGTVIARLDDGAEAAATETPRLTAADAGGEDRGSEPATGQGVANVRATSVDRVAQADARASAAISSARPTGRVLATPLVRRLAREHSVDLDAVKGSGPGGRIVRADIEDALAHHGTNAESEATVSTAPEVPVARDASDPRGSEAVPFDKVRQVISRRLAESSSTTPHFSVTAVADVEDLLALRAELNLQLEESRTRISVNDLVVRACAIALRLHPDVNASYSAEDRGSTLLHGRVNIGIAVASEAGLVVPVIPDADEKTVSHIAAESKHLVRLAQAQGLNATHLTGGTFTISNLGMYGVEQFTAIINPPEGAILAVGSALPEAVVRDGEIAARHTMRLTLSADHRIIDGALAARFLDSLTTLIEHPMRLLA